MNETWCVGGPDYCFTNIKDFTAMTDILGTLKVHGLNKEIIFYKIRTRELKWIWSLTFLLGLELLSNVGINLS